MLGATCHVATVLHVLVCTNASKNKAPSAGAFCNRACANTAHGLGFQTGHGVTDIVIFLEKQLQNLPLTNRMKCCRDLRALLKLLTHLTQRDLIDFGSTEAESGAVAANGAGQTVDVAQLVFLGLDILIPLISLELLGYPKLCVLYFQLLAYMMEVGVSCKTSFMRSLESACSSIPLCVVSAIHAFVGPNFQRLEGEHPF